MESVKMEARFKIGEVVYERIRPGQKLIVNRFANNLYFCRSLEDVHRKDLVFFERELMPEKVASEKTMPEKKLVPEKE